MTQPDKSEPIPGVDRSFSEDELNQIQLEATLNYELSIPGPRARKLYDQVKADLKMIEESGRPTIMGAIGGPDD